MTELIMTANYNDSNIELDIANCLNKVFKN